MKRVEKKRIGWRFPFKAFLKSLGVIKMTKLEIFTTRKKINLVPTQKKMENNDIEISFPLLHESQTPTTTTTTTTTTHRVNTNNDFR